MRVYIYSQNLISCIVGQITVSSHDVITLDGFLFFLQQSNRPISHETKNQQNKDNKLKNLNFAVFTLNSTLIFLFLRCYALNFPRIEEKKPYTWTLYFSFFFEVENDDVTSIASSPSQLLLPFDKYEWQSSLTAYKNVEYFRKQSIWTYVCLWVCESKCECMFQKYLYVYICVMLYTYLSSPWLVPTLHLTVFVTSMFSNVSKIKLYRTAMNDS